MDQKSRIELLDRHAAVNRWLSRIYDQRRTPEHRREIWNFLMTVADPKLKQLLIITRTLDEQSVEFWDDPHHKN